MRGDSEHVEYSELGSTWAANTVNGGGGQVNIMDFLTIWVDLPLAAASASLVSLYSTRGIERGELRVDTAGEVTGVAGLVGLGAANDDGLAEIDALGDFGNDLSEALGLLS